MLIQRPISWFVTDTGRKFSFALVTTFGIGAAAFKFVPNTIMLYKYKELVHHYRDSKPVELSADLKDSVQKCLDILNISNKFHKLVQPFSVIGFDLFNAGSLKSKYGAAIGIPVNFTYKSMADIEKDNVQVNLKLIDWKSEVGKKLAEALILTEDEKEFALCREILSLNNFKTYIQPVYSFACVFTGYNLAQTINRKLNLYSAPLVVRGVLYALVTVFSVGMYYFLYDFTEVHYETKVDKELCEIDPKFMEAGVSFYDKLLKRNQALRELMGREGEAKYSIKGNENYFLRQPHIALVHRKKFFELKRDGDDITE